MAISVFRYKTDLVNPAPQAFPQRTATLRPRMAVALASETAIFPCFALVDSGADDCLFPASYGSKLGLNVLTGRHYTFGGVGTIHLQDAYFFDLEIMIQNLGSYLIPIGFTKALEDFGTGLLGQNGFFDHFRVAFNFRKGIFTLTR